jgi:adenylate kinase family enzyme
MQSTLANMLGQKYGIPVLDFKSYWSSHYLNEDMTIQEEYKTCVETGGHYSADLYKRFYGALLTREPYQSKGLILKNFITSRQELENSTKVLALPDAYIFLSTETEVAAKRILKRELALIEIREAQRIESLKDAPPDVVQNSPSLIQPEDVVLEELYTRLENEKGQIADLQGYLQSLNLAPCLTCSSTKCIRPSFAEMERVASRFLKCRESILAFPTRLNDIKSDVYRKLGLRKLSNLGKFCPVALKNSPKARLDCIGSIPVILDDYVYYLKDEHAVKTFLENPYFYNHQNDPKPVLATATIIVGNEKAGKTTLAKGLCEDPNVVYITASSVVEAILAGDEVTLLAEDLSTTLKSGNPLSDNLLVDAIVQMANRLSSSGKGWVLDGFPLTKNQVYLFENAGLQPHLYFSVMIEKNTALDRAYHDFQVNAVESPIPALNAEKVISDRYEATKNQLDEMHEYVLSKYGNWVTLDGGLSKWALRHKIRSQASENLLKRENYLDLKSKGFAAPVANIGLSREYLTKTLGHFADYCPVSFVDYEILIRNPVTSDFVAEFEDSFFIMNGKEEMEKFLKNPSYYTTKLLPKDLPTKRPKQDMKSMFPKTLSLKGYCPVTFYEGGFSFNSIVPGAYEYIVDYKDQIFAFANNEALELFMKYFTRNLGSHGNIQTPNYPKNFRPPLLLFLCWDFPWLDTWSRL